MAGDGTDWLEMKKCRSCGKKFPVLYPQLWRYKRMNGSRTEYFCSWGCLRKSEPKEERKDETEMEDKRVKRDRVEIARKIIEMAKDGQAGAPVIRYLEELGYQNPVQAWQDIKRYCRKQAPELYAQLPIRYHGKTTTAGQVEVAEKLPETEKQVPENKATAYKEGDELPPGEMKVTIKKSFAEMKKPADERILGQEPLEVASVYSRVIDGAIYRKLEGGRMYLIRGTTAIELTAYQWFKLTEEILVAIRQLDISRPSQTLEPEEYTGNNGPLK